MKVNLLSPNRRTFSHVRIDPYHSQPATVTWHTSICMQRQGAHSVHVLLSVLMLTWVLFIHKHTHITMVSMYCEAYPNLSSETYNHLLE